MYTLKVKNGHFYIEDNYNKLGVQDWTICHFLLCIDVYTYYELLVEKFNGYLYKDFDLSGVIFKNLKDAENALEYLESLYMINKIEGKI